MAQKALLTGQVARLLSSKLGREILGVDLETVRKEMFAD